MRPERRQTANSGGSGSFDEPITAANYQARALDMIRAKGAGVVIRTAECQSKHAAEFPVNEVQWNAWLTYLEGLGVPVVFARKHGMLTVPAAWPEDFDRDAPPSDLDYRPPPKVNPHAFGRRRLDFAALLQSFPEPQRRQQAAPTDPETRLAQLKDHYAANPIGIDPALMTKAAE